MFYTRFFRSKQGFPTVINADVISAWKNAFCRLMANNSIEGEEDYNYAYFQ